MTISSRHLDTGLLTKYWTHLSAVLPAFVCTPEHGDRILVLGKPSFGVFSLHYAVLAFVLAHWTERYNTGEIIFSSVLILISDSNYLLINFRRLQFAAVPLRCSE